MEAASISRANFPPVERSQWLTMQREEERPATLSEAHAGRWGVLQRVDDPNAKRANAQAQTDLANGASGLSIVFEGAPNAFGFGLPAKPEALAAALHGIQLQRTNLRIDVHPASRASVDWMVEIMRRRRVDASRLDLSFGIDPAAILASVGHLRMSIEALRASMPQSLAHFFAMGLPAVLLEADARVIHNAGASPAQELGVMLSSVVSHLRLFEEARQPLIYAIPHIGFAMCTDQDQQLSLSKLHALRRLWLKVQAFCSLPPAEPRIHVETSYRMLTAGDPGSNIIRATLAAEAAARGGANTITVLPHTLSNGLPDREARRMACNTQLLLMEEGKVHRQATAHDLEAKIAALCEEGWEEFRRIEAEGGLLDSLVQGRVQGRVMEARRQRLQKLERTARTTVPLARPAASQLANIKTLKAERRAVATGDIPLCQTLPIARLEEMGGAGA